MMKAIVPAELERKRIIAGRGASTATYGMNGAFTLRYKNKSLFVIASDGGEWDHVSVSLKSRTPTWEEMCYVKDLFFREDEVVIQYHPAKADYVNNCNTCLHMWRPQNEFIPTPPRIMVGI